jgi:hypothetical protein
LAESDPRKEVLERYFEAIRVQDWEALGGCLSASVERTGPYRDVFRGRDDYVAYLSKIIPTLESYSLNVDRVRELEDGSLCVELNEVLDLAGVRSVFPEVLLFGFDDEGAIDSVDIYIKQPPRGRSKAK